MQAIPNDLIFLLLTLLEQVFRLMLNKGDAPTSMNAPQIIRTKRRTLALQIAPDANLIVRAPIRASEETIRQAIQRHMPWILKRQRLARETFRPPVKYIAGEEFPYLGEWHKLLVLPDASIPFVFNEKEFLLSETCLPKAGQLFEKWYKEKAFEIISNRIKPYAEMSGLKYARISITSAKKRWGSCSSKGNLNFSWRLVMTPLAVVDYVIVHELAHLEVRNHSSRFWRKVCLLFPDYRQSRQWLRKNHRLLPI